jgi:hypothetical protein
VGPGGLEPPYRRDCHSAPYKFEEEEEGNEGREEEEEKAAPCRQSCLRRWLPSQYLELKLVCGYTCSYDTTSRWPRAVARGTIHGMDSTVHVMVVLFMGHVMALVHVMVVLFMGMSLGTLFTHKQ